MDTIQTGIFLDKLLRRRLQVSNTLQYLEKEQKEVGDNVDWIDQAAHENRVRLLGRLTDWYLEERRQIDKALARINAQSYGLCMACHKAIDRERLKTFPETDFCVACQDMRESFEKLSKAS
jgi:RNA polymerase-binding transcription factor DksA